MSKKKQAVWGIVITAVALTLLVPDLSVAGSLDPSAAPAPTMKTLDQMPPTWSQTLPAAQRFELVLVGAGVLDKETGLVWEQSPSTTTTTWANAMHTCLGKVVGNRKGWRLPTIEELASLVDPYAAYPGPYLPSGHPFSNAPLYSWSATTDVVDATFAFYMGFGSGGDGVGYSFKTGSAYMWCVRGGQGYDGQ